MTLILEHILYILSLIHTVYRNQSVSKTNAHMYIYTVLINILPTCSVQSIYEDEVRYLSKICETTITTKNLFHNKIILLHLYSNISWASWKWDVQEQGNRWNECWVSCYKTITQINTAKKLYLHISSKLIM